jgi:hypothetical protein
MVNQWIIFMKEFRNRPENAGMTPTEMMHYGSIEYRAGQDGSGMKSMLKKGKNAVSKANNLAKTAQQVVNNNEALINATIGSENSALLKKGLDYTDKARNTVNQISGGKLSVKGIAKKANTVAKVADKVYTQNRAQINNAVGPDVANMLAKIQATGQVVQAGGKFNMKKALRKTVNTIHKVGEVTDKGLAYADKYGPLAANFIPGGAEVMNAVNSAHQVRDMTKMAGAGTRTGGNYKRVVAKGSMIGSTTSRTTGGSFRGPQSGGSFYQSSFGDPPMNNYNAFANRMPRGKDPNLSNRALAV